MYAHVLMRRVAQLGLTFSILAATHAAAQTPAAAQHQHTSGPSAQKEYQSQPASDREFPAATTERPVAILEGHTTRPSQHEGHVVADGDQQIPATRDGSGTSWLPDQSPMYAVHKQAGRWTLMGHGNVFLQYLKDEGSRGRKQTGSINWLMGMGQRPLGAGQLTVRGMISFEPWTTGDCGYPDLLASGEFCNGEPLHDQQHPHDLFMELAAQYNRPLGNGLHLELYGGPIGEPALGPVAFMHRISALPNAVAPIAHHWFDSTHITYGLVTGGIYAKRWKIEGSVFNGREPDENRTDFDFGSMDSWSARVWFLPTARWALQFSGGRLNEAEPAHDLGTPTDVDRLTASATYHHTPSDTVLWATTVGWGRNAERGGNATNALLLESSITVRERDAWYGRLEWAEKSEHDLVLDDDGVFDVAKVQGGYTRYLAPWKGLTPGLGALLSTSIVPARLEPVYGGRFNAGFGVYLTLRPAPARRGGPSGPPAASGPPAP